MLSLAVSVWSSVLAQAAVYKKVNPDGSVEFSDIQQVESEEVDIKPAQTIPAIKIPPASVTKKSEPETESIETFKYDSLEIISPKDDAGVRDNAGQFTATAILEPALRPQYEHHIEWLLDGNKVESATGLELKIENLARGTHQLQIRVVNFDGNTIIQSPVITFHILRVVISAPK